MNLMLRNRNRNYPFFNDFEDFWKPFAMDKLDEESWVPRVDIEDNNEAVFLHMDVPGVKKEDINVDFHDGVLTISGKRESREESKEKNQYRMERRYGSFRRSFQIETPVDEHKVSAKMDNGELSVVLPKSLSKEAKRIQID
jgi:HSP20 family protein